MADVDLKHVTKLFGRNVRAVDDLTLHIPDGKFVVLLGPSGCGKSTTLRLIAGLEQEDAGEIHIGGKLVSGVPTQKRDIAFVFQNYALYPHMTVAGNIGFALKMRGLSAEAMTQQVRQTAQTLGLEEYLDRYPAQLSGGQRQRVALGRAIVRNPAVFLLDEPLSNLDALLRADMRVELVKLQRRLEGTFVFVTHDQVEALTLADLIVVMRSGLIQQQGTAEDVYERPANTYVAGFIGSPRMNFLEGEFVTENGQLYLSNGHARLPLSGQPAALASRLAGGSVVLGFRPEHARPVPAGELVLKVELVETLGSQKFIHGSTEGWPQLTVSVDPASRPASDEVIQLALAPEKLHFFDRATGARLHANAGM
jgi:ABC-type sugar transport system ATPase subunit